MSEAFVIVIVWLLDLQLLVQSVAITTKIDSSNSDEVFVGELPAGRCFPPPIKLKYC